MSKANNNFTWKEGVTLREYFDEKFNGNSTALALQAKEYERRLEQLNHEAQQLKDMQNTYVPRETFEANMKNINEAIKTLELSKATLEGKATQSSVYVSYLFSAIGIVMGIIGFFTK